MINIEQVRELIELMVEHELSEIRIREGETAINLRKGPSGEPVVYAAPPPPGLAPAPTPTPAEAAPPAEAAAEADDGLVAINSPMVGTFYSSSDPQSPPFASVGSEVSKGQTVCIIEAMKVFNEINSDVAGTIERILVQNDQAVEYGQPLMLVRPKS